MAHDALGRTRATSSACPRAAARPVQAALTSAATFAVGAALPLVTALAAPRVAILGIIAVVSLPLASRRSAPWPHGPVAHPAHPGAARVAFWGALAMAVTAGVGRLVGAAAP